MGRTVLLVILTVAVGCIGSDAGADLEDAALLAEIANHVLARLGDQEVAFSTRVYCGTSEPALCEIGSHFPEPLSASFAEALGAGVSSDLPIDLLLADSPPDVVVSLSPIAHTGADLATVLIRYEWAGEIIVVRLPLTRVEAEWRAGEEVVVGLT